MNLWWLLVAALAAFFIASSIWWRVSQFFFNREQARGAEATAKANAEWKQRLKESSARHRAKEG